MRQRGDYFRGVRKQDIPANDDLAEWQKLIENLFSIKDLAAKVREALDLK